MQYIEHFDIRLVKSQNVDEKADQSKEMQKLANL
jgi:hypothetical protein